MCPKLREARPFLPGNVETWERLVEVGPASQDTLDAVRQMLADAQRLFGSGCSERRCPNEVR